jgi:tRNA 5-methylaminomethyl-2-thiouridine biosynthesis bifunctional protein
VTPPDDRGHLPPADILFTPGEPPRSVRFGDRYHARGGAARQAQEVFLAGNGLPSRWRGRDRFVVLETGFGLGQTLLATWAAWRDDAQRCRHLHLVSVEAFPPTRDDLRQAHAEALAAGDRLATALVEAWPARTPGLHRLSLDEGQVDLLLGFGDVEDLLPALELQADAVFLDGFAPRVNPAMWSRRVLAAIGRLAAPGATAASWCVAGTVRDGLQAAGFRVERRPGFDGKRHRLEARFEPGFVPRRTPARAMAVARPGGPGALVIGGGLAGAFAADALRREGWDVTVLDRHPAPAAEASGNPAGLFHGVAHRQDGLHARWSRAAALYAAPFYRACLSAGVPGAVDGVLRLSAGPVPADAVEDYLRVLAPAAAAAGAGLPPGATAAEAWLYPGGGWVSPAALCRHLLAAPAIRWAGGRAVAQLVREGEHWAARDAAGELLAQGAVVVLAQGTAPSLTPAGALPDVSAVRGQLTWLTPAPGELPVGAGVPWPRIPLTGDGYALGLPDGRLLCGATTHHHDATPGLRAADHAHNLARLARLTGMPALSSHGASPGGDPALTLGGRVGWRAQTPDRLPRVGPVPVPADERPAGPAPARCRQVPRLPGLFVLGGLGSRGLTWGPLAAAIVAAQISGSPVPLETDLLDAVDPARDRVREGRRRQSPPPSPPPPPPPPPSP